MAKRFPFSDFPSGWYVVGLSEELPPKGVLPRRYFDREIVLYRTESGELRATDPFCPHLGGHLGQARVEGDVLRCGFHGWKFDGAGKCVRAYGQNVPKTGVATWRAVERNQTLLVWFDARGREPTWEVPVIDPTGWTPFRFRKLAFNSHPQETSENSVDFGHFTEVHSFSKAWVVEEAVAEGPLLKATYGITKSFDLPKPLGQLGVDVTFHVQVHGLGYSYVQGEVPSLRIQYRHLILSTPVHDGRVHMRLATSVKKLPNPILTEMAHRMAFKGLCDEVESDMPIWEAKRYVERPVLAKGDGPIHKYRKWAKQFYPEAAA